MTWLKAAVIIVAGLVVDAPAWHGAFLWDDPQYVTANALLRSPAGLAQAWFQPGVVMEYYPMQETALWLQWQLLGPHPFGYHLINALLHVAGALLLWRFFTALGLRLGWLGGLLFAIHPGNVESVAWISELKNTLSLPPLLVAMTAMVRVYETHHRRDYVIALVCFTLAMLVKISVAPFPFAILLYAWWRNGRVEARDLRTAAPFLAIALLFSGLTVYAYLHFAGVNTDHPAIPAIGGPFARVVLAVTTVSFYFARSLSPWPVWPLYPQWSVGTAWPLAVALALMWIGLLGWLWTKRESFGRHALLAVGFFLLFIAPFSGLATQSYMYFAWVMDHLVYVAMIGPIGLLVAGLEAFLPRLALLQRRMIGALVALLFAAYALMSWSYSFCWRSSESLWTYAVASAPTAWLAHYNLGNAYRYEQRFDEAVVQYRVSLALHPGYDWTHNNLGICLAESPDNLPAAMDEYRAALRIRPAFAEAHNNLANALVESGRYGESFGEFRAALALRPDFIAARYNYALALMKDNRHAEAAVQLREVIRQKPDMNAAHFLLQMAR